MPTHSTIDTLAASAEFSLCLSRVFMAPQAKVTLEDMQGPLMDDLQQLAEQLPVVAGYLPRLATNLAAINGSHALILGYSQLFLTPPAPAPLNLGAYLDGALMGKSAQAMLALYQRHGLELDPDGHQLPDHLALNLHWLAWVYSGLLEPATATQDADTTLNDALCMLRDFSLPALQRLSDKLAALPTEGPAIDLWILLASLVRDQVAADLHNLSSLKQSTAQRSMTPANRHTELASFEQSQAQQEQLTCRGCGQTFVSDPVLAEMRLRLTQAGVSADHLTLCLHCRDGGQSIDVMKPPGAGIKAWN